MSKYPNGIDLCVGTFDGDTLTRSYTDCDITFDTPASLVYGEEYAIVIKALEASAYNNGAATPYSNIGHGGIWALQSTNSGVTWVGKGDNDIWFKTYAGETLKEYTLDFPSYGLGYLLYVTTFIAQTFIAGSSYDISKVTLKLKRSSFSILPGTITVSIQATEAAAPGKATDPVPANNTEGVWISGIDRLTQLSWTGPVGETPDYKVYFRAQGGDWTLYATITDGNTNYALSDTILNALEHYSIYEWRVDTYDPETELTTTGDTWTFISDVIHQFTTYTRRSDYNADQVWNPTTGEWSDISDFEYTGGGRYKGRVLIVGHRSIYYGDL